MKNITKLMILSILFFSCFCGCNRNAGLIPSGYYTYPEGPIIDENNIYILYEGDFDLRTSFCWEIDGNEVQCWTSGTVTYRAKIVGKDNRIYFESDDEVNYEVIYDAASKSITLILLNIVE
mgnify:FL=1